MDQIKTKRCSECGEVKPVTEFYKRRQRNGELSGYQHTCKACAATVRKRYYKPHSKIKYQLGLTWEQVEELTSKGECEACGSTKRLCIDHCHDTKKPRGLLCHKCNTALGLVDDDSQRLLNLSQYLERSKQQE